MTKQWVRKAYICLLFVTSAAVCYGVAVATAGSDDTKPAAEVLAAGMRAQIANSRQPVEVKYTRRVDGGGVTGTGRYVRNGTTLFAEEKYANGSAMATTLDTATRAFRQLFRSKQGRCSGWIAIGAAGALLGTQDNYDPLLRPLGDEGETLIDVVGRGAVIGSVDVDGHACWRVDTKASPSDPSVSRYSVWVDTSIGCSPRKLEIAFPDGRKPKVIGFLDYKEVANGVWFPAQETCTTQTRKDPKLPVSPLADVVITWEADSLTAGTEVTAAECKISFPSGTEVRDDVHERSYTIP